MTPPIIPKDHPFTVRVFWLAKKIIEVRISYRRREYDFILSHAQAREMRDALDAVLREVEGTP